MSTAENVIVGTLAARRASYLDGIAKPAAQTKTIAIAVKALV